MLFQEPFAFFNLYVQFIPYSANCDDLYSYYLYQLFHSISLSYNIIF